MKNFFNIPDKNELEQRIQKLSPNAIALWGKMNAGEMLCHLYDSLKVASGEVRPKHIGNFLTRMSWLKKMVLRGRSFQKNVNTAKEVNPQRDGTKPTDFEKDKKRLLDEMQLYFEKAATLTPPEHPIFGNFSTEDWGRQVYMHTDHHLQQFGV